jgi:glycosyltransferase involved in cell wall biosynthesis
MKAFVIHQMDLARRDGIVFHVVELAAGFVQSGVAAEVVAPLRSRRDEDFPVPVRYLPMPTRLPLLGLLVYELAVTGYLLTRRELWSRQAVFYIRRGTLLFAPLLLGRLFGVPALLEENGILAYGVGKGEQSFVAPLARKLTELQYLCATHIVAVSQGARRNVLTRAPGAAHKTMVVPNGVNTVLNTPQDKRICRDRLGLPDDGERYIVFVGSFYKNRGVQHLISAMPEILQESPAATLLLVGDPTNSPDLFDLARQLDIAHRVRFVGFQPYEMLPTYIGAADVCVAPYTSIYGPEDSLSPLKLYAYMACGRPVVMTDVPVEIDAVDRTRTITTVAADSPAALATGILALLRDPERMVRLGAESRAVALKHSWKNSAQSILAMIQQAH